MGLFDWVSGKNKDSDAHFKEQMGKLGEKLLPKKSSRHDNYFLNQPQPRCGRPGVGIDTCDMCRMDLPNNQFTSSGKCSDCQFNFSDPEVSIKEEVSDLCNIVVEEVKEKIAAQIKEDLDSTDGLLDELAKKTKPAAPLTNVPSNGKMNPTVSNSSEVQEDKNQEETVTDTPEVVKVASLIPNAEKLIEEGFNVMLIGRHGCGKTESVRQLAEDKGFTLKSYSCATLDPFTDLVGVPVPKVDKDGKDYLKMIRPVDIDEADVVFFDELNRSRPEVQDAVLEIINNRTINGEPLPKLKACWAAINPPNGEYNVDDLDPALMDRFDLYIEMPPLPSVAYMQQRVPKPVALALKRWWDEHDKSKRKTYISPRRLMKIGLVFEATRNKVAMLQSLPPEADLDSNKLWQMLDEAVNPEKAKSRKSGLGDASADFNYDNLGDLYMEQKKLIKFLKDNPAALETHRKVSDALKSNVSGQSLVSSWAETLDALHKPVLESLINGFSQPKRSQMRTTYMSMITSNKNRAKKLTNLHSVIDGLAKTQAGKLPSL